MTDLGASQSDRATAADHVREALLIELAWCHHAKLSVSETAQRILDGFVFPPTHEYWGAGEPDCPRDIKAGNGELHTLRCKICGKDNPREQRCFAARQAAPETEDQ